MPITQSEIASVNASEALRENETLKQRVSDLEQRVRELSVLAGLPVPSAAPKFIEGNAEYEAAPDRTIVTSPTGWAEKHLGGWVFHGMEQLTPEPFKRRNVLRWGEGKAF